MKVSCLSFILIFLCFSLASAQGELLFEGSVISGTAKLRNAPNKTAKTLLTLKRGSKLYSESKESQKGWYYVLSGKTKGWIHGNDFEFQIDDYVAPSEPSAPVGWFLIGQTERKDSGYRYYYLFSSVKKKSGSIELWTRIVPFDRVKYAKSKRLPKSFAYAIEFVTVDCEDKRLSTEGTTLYDVKENNLPYNDFLSRSYRDPIVPNSMGELLWKVVCK